MTSEETKVVGAFPPPPAYYKLFAGKPIGASSDGAGSEGATAASSAFPLQPPRLPEPGGTYKLFGMPYSTKPVAEELLLPAEKVLVPPPGEPIDYRAELKSLLDSVMANYLQFMEMLVSAPSRANEKVSDLETLFVNMHSLLNRYRAHQARHLILEKMRKQAEEHAAVTAALKAAIRESVTERQAAVGCLHPPEALKQGDDATKFSAEDMGALSTTQGAVALQPEFMEEDDDEQVLASGNPGMQGGETGGSDVIMFGHEGSAAGNRMWMT